MGLRPVNRKIWPVLLFAACIVPTGFGLVRIFEITTEFDFALDLDARHVDGLPLLLHSIGGIGFLCGATFQVLPGHRRRFPGGHRKAGRYLVPLGLLAALSGTWMTVLHPGISGPLLYWGRICASLFWAVALVAGFAAMRRGEFGAHGRWMIRAYAMALPAGTLAFMLLPVMLVFGEERTEHLTEIIQVAAWPLHLAVAEWVIRRGQPPRLHPSTMEQGAT